MAYLLLYGNGWTQRWRVAADKEDRVRSMLSSVGSDRTGQLPVRDAASDVEVILVVAWAMVAAAVMLDEEMPGSAEAAAGGQYP
ncbi:hypothetical protein [Nocardioides luteus]|uniref:Uncharacterized protein n=1 Tax=Nocardioides luteus TaxID=1844 RepID=A0A1J4N6F5_9ACTN|nr:hypothetical protein [Nocardioides luteus]OIJ27099.1 hypothetical protein UG56_008490 [Nocardioides luteus]